VNALDRARDDLANDRAWKAHDRLHGLIGQQYDREIVELLAEAHQAMRNYPAAGALWFVLGRNDELAQHAIEAWHEKCPNDEARLNSLPKRIRVNAEGAPVDELRNAAARWKAGERPPVPGPAERAVGDRVFEVGCVTLLALFALAVLIGLVDFVSMLFR
jgi:hypothetical protein